MCVESFFKIVIFYYNYYLIYVYVVFVYKGKVVKDVRVNFI